MRDDPVNDASDRGRTLVNKKDWAAPVSLRIRMVFLLLGSPTKETTPSNVNGLKPSLQFHTGLVGHRFSGTVLTKPIGFRLAGLGEPELFLFN